MKVAVGSDHAGYALKQHVMALLKQLGHDVFDLGTHHTASTDYPAYCAAVGRAVVRGDADRGVVIGGSGQGEQIAANKVRGVRAALCNDLYSARMSRAHNDTNVLSLGARVAGEGLVDDIVEIWFATAFEGGRHRRRVEQLADLEATFCDPDAQDNYLETLLEELSHTTAATPPGDTP